MDELEAVYLRLREMEVEGVAVIKLRVNSRGVNCCVNYSSTQAGAC